MKPFAKDQSKNPPPRNWLDVLLRRFSRIAYGLAVLLMYTLASTASIGRRLLSFFISTIDLPAAALALARAASETAVTSFDSST